MRDRIDKLEQQIAPAGPQVWVRIFQFGGQMHEDAVSAWEVENGPLDGRNAIMRVIIDKPFALKGQQVGAGCPA